MSFSYYNLARARWNQCLIFAFLIVGFGLISGEAHTFHTSLTRMDYNAKDKSIEITIQLFNHDVQPMIEKRLKKRVDLEKTAEVDQEVFKYLEENFIFQTKQGETQRLQWVGKEFNNDMLLVYLEIHFEAELEGTKLQNTIFFENFSEQTNIVVAHFGDKKIDLLFKPGDKFKDL